MVVHSAFAVAILLVGSFLAGVLTIPQNARIWINFIAIILSATLIEATIPSASQVSVAIVTLMMGILGMLLGHIVRISKQRMRVRRDKTL